jgi:pimeloyl-ACP methyl ester carboxylesterase
LNPLVAALSVTRNDEGSIMSGGGEPEQLVVEHDGLRIAVLDWGGDGEPLLFLHPTGFCAGFFDPLARRLRDRYRPVGVDARGHGASDTPATRDGLSYDHLAGDVVAVLDRLGIDSCVALGESLGGGVGLLVDAARPGLIRRLMLCEAIAFDRSTLVGRAPGPEIEGHENHMAVIARKRRAVWPDRATVRASYAARPPLDVLAPEALDAYVRWGFVDRADGTIELACAPADEAAAFEAAMDDDSAPAAWHHLAELSCAATVVHGDASDLPSRWFEAQAERARADRVAVTGGHFFLQEDSGRAESLVREHLA